MNRRNKRHVKRRKRLRTPSITISPTSRGGDYRDVIRFARAQLGLHGTTANAIANAVRESQAFRDWAQGPNDQRRPPA